MEDKIQNLSIAQICKKIHKTPKETIEKLLYMVFTQQRQIKNSANELSINVSTAKGIVQKFRKRRLQNRKKPISPKPCGYKPIDISSKKINLVSSTGLQFSTKTS